MYEMGIAAAFTLWLIDLIMTIVRKNSLLERNLRKLGKRTSMLGFGITDAKQERTRVWVATVKIILRILLTIPFVLFSWLYVAIIVLTYAYFFKKDFGAPMMVKEYRWKMKNMDMSFDEIIKGIVKMEGLNESEYERVRQEWVEHIENLNSK